MSQASKLIIFARFHAKPGREIEVSFAQQETVAATRREKGCLSIEAFRSIRDTQLFYIHSRWVARGPTIAPSSPRARTTP
jgi:quinol monooxygenase YgiN